MPKADRSTQINVVLPAEVLERLREYIERSGYTMTHVVSRAIRRDLDSPPPVLPDPPLPPAPPEPAPKPAKKTGRKRG